MPAPVPFFDLLQFLSLFVREICSHFLMCFRHDLVNSPASLLPNLLKLGGRLIDDRRNFGDLVRRQIELCTEPFLHSGANQRGLVKFKEKMPSVQSSKESAGDCPCDEHKDESNNKFPLQCAVHFKNSS